MITIKTQIERQIDYHTERKEARLKVEDYFDVARHENSISVLEDILISLTPIIEALENEKSEMLEALEKSLQRIEFSEQYTEGKIDEWVIGKKIIKALIQKQV